jgi:hypothetical protein
MLVSFREHESWQSRRLTTVGLSLFLDNSDVEAINLGRIHRRRVFRIGAK